MTRMMPRLVYRPLIGRVCAVLVAIFCAWWALDLLLDRRWTWLAESLPGLVAVCLAAHLILWRPEVVVDDQAVLLRNVARDVRVPWPVLRDVQTRYALTLITDRSRYVSWAATARGRPSRHQSGRTNQPDVSGADPGARLADARWLPDRPHRQQASRDLEADSGAAAFMVEQRWSAWRSSPKTGTDRPDDQPDAETVSWNRVEVAALALAVVLAVVLAVIPWS